MLKHFLILFIVASTTASAQEYGSEFRKRYEGEKNGPYGECKTDWTRLAPGLHYRAITCLGKNQSGDLDLHLVRVDPERWVLNAYLSKDSSARAVVKDKDAAFAINANFFDTERNPMGVVVRSEEQVRHPRTTGWQSIFLVAKDGTAKIIRDSDWKKYENKAFMAVQAGPRLIVGGHTTRVRQSYAAARAGVCIQRPNQVIFFATPANRKLDMYEISRITRRDEIDGGLACHEAMLFDGGHSTQIYLKTGKKTVSVKGDPVPVLVYVKEREERLSAGESSPGGSAD